jgi:hypothetical protein
LASDPFQLLFQIFTQIQCGNCGGSYRIGLTVSPIRFICFL